MLPPEAVEAAADLLADLRLRANGRDAQLPDLPEGLRPDDMDDAYRVQEALRGRLAKRGLGPVAGWKIGCTSPVMREYLGVPHPCMGTLYAKGVQRGTARLRHADFFRPGLECELAVQLRADLPAREGGHDAGSVRPAVAGAMTSVEIVDERFEDFRRAGAASLTADDFFSAGCVLGADRPITVLPDLATLEGGFRVNGAKPEATGTGAAILGHPLAALAWLADLRAAQGAPLREGQVVTLGSVVKTIHPGPGTVVEAVFTGLPPVRIEVV